MALTREQRFIIKRDMVAEIDRDHNKWSFRRTNMLLREFGCTEINSDYDDGFEFEHAIADLQDDDLAAMSKVVLPGSQAPLPETSQDEARLESTPIWNQDMVRVFLSHSAKHKAFAAEVAKVLAPMGVCGFVAHDSMAFDQSWQEQIQLGLKTMDALVVILHSEVNESAWCQQEIGWALGTNTPFYLVRLGSDPKGFIGATQYPQVSPARPDEVANHIARWLSRKSEFSEALVDGVITALERSGSYPESIAISNRILPLESLSPSQWERIDKAIIGNDQVGGSGGATRILARFYSENKRAWPLNRPRKAIN